MTSDGQPNACAQHPEAASRGDDALISEVRAAIRAGEIRRAMAVIDRLPSFAETVTGSRWLRAHTAS